MDRIRPPAVIEEHMTPWNWRSIFMQARESEVSEAQIRALCERMEIVSKGGGNRYQQGAKKTLKKSLTAITSYYTPNSRCSRPIDRIHRPSGQKCNIMHRTRLRNLRFVIRLCCFLPLVR